MPTFPESERLLEADAATPSPLMFREGRYLWMLLALLMSATVFEGYDVTIFHLCTPDIARTFHLDDRAVGLMASVVRLGGMIAFVVVMASDRVGRKPSVAMIMITEEFPDSARGRGVALLHMVGLLGVVAGGRLHGYVADSRFGWRG